MRDHNQPFFTKEEVKVTHDKVIARATHNKFNGDINSKGDANQYFGNYEDGGAMSQSHSYQLLLNRFGRGNFVFECVDKKKSCVTRMVVLRIIFFGHRGA
eukprot:COSAG02_NODE_9009_length_2362_cov_2.899249_2_plen_100_part_00